MRGNVHVRFGGRTGETDHPKGWHRAPVRPNSRALVGYRWGHSEDTVRLEAALRAGLAARGVPAVVYVDNGSAFVSSQLLRALASLGIRLTHSKPGQPAGRGKIERVFRTVREQFLVELAAPGALAAVGDLGRLNELFTGWVEGVYHHRVHSETGAAPLARFLAPGPPTLPTTGALHEAFLWSERRTVTKTATISLHGNTYEVDAALVGRRIDVVFDPFDLTSLQVRYQNRPMGVAVPHRIARHVHPHAGPDTTAAAPPTPTGIDYLALVAAAHNKTLAALINYNDLPTANRTGPDTGDPAQAAADPGDTADADDADDGLPAELASFEALGHALVDGQLPGQLDLTHLIDPDPDPEGDPERGDGDQVGQR